MGAPVPLAMVGYLSSLLPAGAATHRGVANAVEPRLERADPGVAAIERERMITILS